MRLLIALLPMAVWAASLRVTVQDPSGGLVAGASVRVSAGGTEFSASTGSLGQAVVADLPAGRAALHVEAAGFAPKDQIVMLRAGENQVRARLQIAGRKDSVSVTEDRREAQTDPRGPALSAVLTQKEIEALPDDPDELRQVLEAMAGPGAVIRVDGFRGGRLPNKSQIQSIRFRLTPYSVEEHDDAFNLVDIQTKPGLGIWHGTMTFGFGDDALNARNFFAPAREPQQARRLDLSATGPLVKNKTSLSLWYGKNSSYDSRATHGVLPAGPFASLVRLPSDATNANARIQQVLPKSHMLRLEYQYAGQDRSNIGVFDLPERLSTSSMNQHVLRVSDSGMLTGKLIHEARFQTQWTTTGAGSATLAPAVIVPGAFSQGGAGQDSQRRAREMDFTDILTFSRGRHNLRAGVEVDGASYRDRDRTNANGTFLFSSLAAYQAAQPIQYTLRVGDVPVSYTQYQFGAFVQDDVRLRKDFSLSLGARYETQTNLGARANLAPRGGFAWSPFHSGKTTIRAGGGVYSQWFDASLYEQVLRVNGSRQSDLVITQPGFPNPYSSGIAGGSVLPPSIITRDPNMVMPYVVRASIGVQQQIGQRFNLMADVRGQRGIHLLRSRNLNAPLAGIGRPDPAAGNIMEIESNANSSMRGFTIQLGPAPTAKGLGHVFWFINYGFSRSIDETDSALSAPTDNFDLRADRGPSLGDARHRVASLVNLTMGKGWQLGTFFHANSALPYNLTTGFDNNGDSAVNDRPAGVGRNSARGAAPWDLSVKLAWTKGAGKARSETSGPQAVRVIIRGDGGGVPDLPMGGVAPALAQLQFYAQAYNVMNHANLTGFVGVLTSPLFGQATMAMAARRMELGVKLSF